MTTRLSKSRYLSGLQCPRRLYLEIHARELATPFEEGTQAILDAGTRVGELARERYPGGVLVDVEYFKVEEGLARTAALPCRRGPWQFQQVVLASNHAERCMIGMVQH